MLRKHLKFDRWNLGVFGVLVLPAGVLAAVALASGSSPSFSFSSDEPGASFTCQLDTGTAAACTSPKTYTGLAPGAHTETIIGSFTVPNPPPPSTVLLGDQSVEATSDSSSAPASEAFGYTASASGTATSASVYLTSTDGATVGLYADSSGKPGALLDKGSIASNTFGWATVPLGGAASIASGTRYWIAVGANAGGQVTYRDKGNSGTNLDWAGAGFASPYSTTSGPWNSNPLSAYVSGTAAPPMSTTSTTTTTPTTTTTTTTTTSTTTSSGFSPVSVVGNKLVNATGATVFLHGADRSGTEYSCIHNTGFFDGTGTDLTVEDREIQSMAAWHINAELIGLNEDCWLGINGAPAAYSGQNYINAIKNLVSTDEANGIYPVISGFWMAPGTTQATGHIALADNDHAPLLWQQVANTFKNDPKVIFRLEQEPTLGYGSEADWQCWAQGDVSYGSSLTPIGNPGKCSGLVSYQTVGMQSLVNIVRGTGATNVIALPGLGYSNMLSCSPSTSPSSCGMLASATPPVTDPAAQLIASVDVYPEGNVCGNQLNTSCYDATYRPVAQAMPLIAGETGENPSTGTTTTTYVDMFMSWMDANANGYCAWAWDSWAQLISSYGNNNTPSTAWGTNYYNHINGG